jgi:hypothetical protein
MSDTVKPVEETAAWTLEARAIEATLKDLRNPILTIAD